MIESKHDFHRPQTFEVRIQLFWAQKKARCGCFSDNYFAMPFAAAFTVCTLGRGRPYKLSDCIGKIHIISVISQAGDPVSREIRGLFFGFLYPPVDRFN